MVGAQHCKCSPGLTQRDVRRVEQREGRVSKRLRVRCFHFRHQHLRKNTGSARCKVSSAEGRGRALNFLPLSRRRATSSGWPFTVDDDRIWQNGRGSRAVRRCAWRAHGKLTGKYLADVGEAALLVLEVQVQDPPCVLVLVTNEPRPWEPVPH